MKIFGLISIKVLLFSFIDVMLMILLFFSILSKMPYHSLIFSTHSTLTSNSLLKRKLNRCCLLMSLSIIKTHLVSLRHYIAKIHLLVYSLTVSASLHFLIRLVLLVLKWIEPTELIILFSNLMMMLKNSILFLNRINILNI